MATKSPEANLSPDRRVRCRSASVSASSTDRAPPPSAFSASRNATTFFSHSPFEIASLRYASRRSTVPSETSWKSPQAKADFNPSGMRLCR